MLGGIVYNIISNIFFVFVGYALHYTFGDRMSPEEYGIMGSILTILDFEYLFLNNGARQSTSRELSSGKYNVKDLIKKSILIQLVLAGVFFSVNFLGAGLFADFLHDDRIEIYIRYSAILVVFNGMMVISQGICEGIHKYKSSAITGIVYAVFKLSAILYVIYFSDAILGAEAGYLTAGVTAIIVGYSLVLSNRKNLTNESCDLIPLGKYIKSTFGFSLFFIVVSVVLSIDTLMVKWYISDKKMAGFYTGAVNFAKVSYFIMGAFFTIILPSVTTKYSKGDYEAAKKQISSFITVIISLIMPITVIISASSGALLQSFYNKSYMVGADSLMVLAWAHFFMGLLVFFNMILNACEVRLFSNVLAVFVIITDILLGIFLMSKVGMLGMALAGLITVITALIISMIRTTKVFSGILDKKHLIILLLNMVLWILVRSFSVSWNDKKLIIIALVYLLTYVVFEGLLFVIGLFNAFDIIKGDGVNKE